MTLRTCSCGVTLTTKNVTPLGRGDMGGYRISYYNCHSCGSTFTVMARDKECSNENSSFRPNNSGRIYFQRV